MRRVIEWEEAITSKCNEFEVICYDEVPSTMDAARSLLPREETLVLTAVQTAGRGRQGKQWISPEAGFFGTFILPVHLPTAKLSGLSLVIGLAVKSAVQHHAPDARLFLKWPNDVLDERDRKIAGVLIEIATKDQATFALCGIGINLLHAPDGVSSVSLRELSGEVSRPPEIGATLAAEVSRTWKRFSQSGFSPFRDEWLHSAAWRGRELTVAGGEIRGTFVGVADDGALLLDREGISYPVVAGELIRRSS